MPFIWRVDPMSLLKECGYSTYRIRKEKVFSQSTVQKLRHNQMISLQEIDTICTITGKSIGKLIEHVESTDEE